MEKAVWIDYIISKDLTSRLGKRSSKLKEY